MEILAIELENFRQFESIDGTPQRIEFAPSGANNVTAIYGTNGAGKSSLLNAFTWSLFARTTKALKHPGLLVNQTALAKAQPGSEVVARVCIEFLAPVGGRQAIHRLERSIVAVAGRDVRPDATPAGRPKLTYATPGVGTEILENPDEIRAYVERLIPSELYQYFFIDGERVANLSKPENQPEIRRAVEVFVGLEELLRGAKSLRDAAESFGKEAQEHEAQNRELEALQKQIDGYRDAIGKRDALLAEIDKNVESYYEEIKSISDRLEAHKETAELEEKRRTLKNQVQSLGDQANALERELFRVVVKDGWAAFALDSAEKFLSANIDLRRKGELPYRIRKPFIEELLERKSCVCGRSLDLSDAEHRAEIEGAIRELQAEIVKSDLSVVQDQLFGATASAKEVPTLRTQVQHEIETTDNNLKDALRRLDLLREAHDEVERRLRGQPEPEIQGLAARRAEFENKVKLAYARHGLVDAERSQLQAELEKAEARQSRISLTTAAGRKAQSRLTLCRSVAQAMEDFYRLERERCRYQLEDQLQQLFRDYSITGYFPRVSPDYALSLIKRIGTGEFDVADSTGEGQALTLAFITAVAKEAILRRAGVSFPIVIDSQFGSLDRNYHRRIGGVLPSHIGQVILIQTKTQWSDEMRAAIRPRLGAEVVLTRRVTRETVDGERIAEGGISISADEEVDIDAGKFPYVELSTTDSTLLRQALAPR